MGNALNIAYWLSIWYFDSFLIGIFLFIYILQKLK